MAEQLAFLGFKAGDVVLVEPSQGDPACGNKQDWWMGQIIWVEGGARDPSAPSLFQAADVDTGQVRWINADEATRLVLQNYHPDQTGEFAVRVNDPSWNALQSNCTNPDDLSDSTIH